MGAKVALCLDAATPGALGKIVEVDLDRSGAGNFADGGEIEAAARLDEEYEVSFDAPGTYFVTVSVTANRGGSLGWGNISNLARVRVVVD